MSAVAWQDRAACAGMDTRLFFVEGRGAEAQAQARRAKAVCARCPVAKACGEFARATGDKWSISGGMTPRQRITHIPKRRAA